MSVLLKIDIYPSILRKLPLKNLVILRRVCYQWKEWIDDYLKRQKILLLSEEDENEYERMTAVTQTLDINYSKIISNKLEFGSNDLYWKYDTPIANSLLRTFPNLEELYICVEQRRAFYENLNYEIMLAGLKNTLKTLIIPGLYVDLCRSTREEGFIFEPIEPIDQELSKIVDCFNECNQLESFGMYEDDCDADKRRSLRLIENQPFLTRLESFWIPATEWIDYQESLPDIAGIADIDSVFLPNELFPNLQRLFLFFECHPLKPNLQIGERLHELSELGHVNLCCLEITIVCLGTKTSEETKTCWLDATFEDSNLPFNLELNCFPGVKTIKFEFNQPLCLKYVLRNCAAFNFIETLIINYKDGVCWDYDIDDAELQLPGNFVELLPKSVNRIRNIEFHLEKQSDEGFRKTDFSEFPYKVKIFHDL